MGVDQLQRVTWPVATCDNMCRAMSLVSFPSPEVAVIAADVVLVVIIRVSYQRTSGCVSERS